MKNRRGRRRFGKPHNQNQNQNRNQNQNQKQNQRQNQNQNQRQNQHQNQKPRHIPDSQKPHNRPSHGHRPSGHGKPPPPQGRPGVQAPKQSPEAFVEGRLQLRGKFGFVLSEQPGLSDLYVDGETLRLAMNGDRVLARVTSGPADKRRAGQIVKVLERARDTVVGVYKRVRNADLLMPESGAEAVRILDKKGHFPKEDDLVAVRITQWPTAAEWAGGDLIEVIGRRGQKDVDVKVLVWKHGLPAGFPPAAEADAQAFGNEVPESALAGRTTFFHTPVFTIDGADAKDFDDAVSLEELPGGAARLGVHIADVSHYVKEDSALDEEALKRGTSVYLVDRVIPMLPHHLSDNLCSLRPNVLRLTLSCVMDIDANGHVTNARVMESAIKSVRRFTYEEVEGILSERSVNGDSPDVIDTVERMGELARVLRQRRFGRGSLDFDFPEPQVKLDASGFPIEIGKRERLESHRLIEEFMLLANEAVARLMSKGPFIYRVHAKPEGEKLTKLKETLQSVGVPVPPGLDDGRSQAFQKILASVEDQPTEPMVNMMVLRSLKQAVYSTENLGHFGLASTCYTHFTSPIRRYPDLIVHRLVRESLRHQSTPERQVHWRRELPPMASHCSQRERLAQDAERESLELKRVQFMEKHVGSSFDGVVSSVTAFGIFVQLTEIFVEGLVHITNLRDDYYVYDEVRHALRGRRTGKAFRMGQEVRVKLAAANVMKRQLDFELERGGRDAGRNPPA